MSLVQYNEIQVTLIKESGKKPDEWVKNYGKRFRELIENGICKYEELKAKLYF